MIILGSPFAHPPGTMLAAIQRIGLTSGLQLCLDASDISSYAGSGQSWNDVSGNGYNFNRGSGSGSDSPDPTFNGSAGGQSASEYWSFDGADFFTLGQANPSWVTNIHKNNAKFAFASWMYVTGLAVADIAGDHGYNGNVSGFSFSLGAAGQLNIHVNNSNGTTTPMYVMVSSASVSINSWQFVSVRLDEAAGTAMLQIQGTQESGAGSYTSPSSTGAGYTLQIGTSGADSPNDVPLRSGTRLASFVAWEGTVPSVADLLVLYNSTKGKYGH